ncbi:MAG: hypothetical protein IKJ68_05930 [Clostridia bacterium]|nr:hypothetical protein [Clostridia bacterium]
MNNKIELSGLIVSPDIYPDSVEKLKFLGFDILFSCKNYSVSHPLMYHADMQITRISDDFYVCAPECFEYYTDILKKYNKTIIRGNTYLSCNYPSDIAYNIIITESLAIHNFKYTDSAVKSNIINKNLINVSQGYTACTLCPVSGKAFITSDAGIYKKLNSIGYDVLLIDDSKIVLPGFDHGFFGGSSVMLSNDLLAVNGKVEDHPNYNNIKSFCLNYGINLLSLCDKPIMDIGSFIKI